jgi:Novel STAND NTPase 1
VGKSSLINAALVPSMTGAKWIVLTLRPHDSPLNEIGAALLQPSAVWRRPPATPLPLRNLIEQAGQRVRRDGKRLLLVIDQFEEALILCDTETREVLASLLSDLAERPVSDVKVLLSVRAEYLNDLPELGLQPPAFGSRDNAREVQPSPSPRCPSLH